MSPAAARRRLTPALPDRLTAAVRRWFAPDAAVVNGLRADLAASRAEAALLRAAASEPDPRRLHAALHRLVEPAGGSASALLTAAGDSWEPRLIAGAGDLSRVLPLLPPPHRLPDRAEHLPGPDRETPAGWLAPCGTGTNPRLWVLGGPLPDGGDFPRGRRLAEVLGGAVRRAADAADAAAEHDRSAAQSAARFAAHEAAAAAGEAAGVLAGVLAALAEHAGATHAALLTAGPPVRRLAAAGPTGTAPVEAVRSENERRLAAAPATGETGPDGVAAFGPDDLRRAGVASLVGRAVRVRAGGPVPAVAVFSRTDGGEFAPHHAEVCRFAGRFLGDLLPRVSATAAVRRKATRDPLTGLANRGTFEDRLEELAVAARAGGEGRGGDDLTLLMCDLDHFKAVNDTHGHQVGDAVLVAAADAFRATLAECRKADRVLPARFGGEELCVLLAGFGRAGAARVAERLRAAVAGIGPESGGRLPDVTVSIGGASLPDDADTPGDLVAAADAALYAAKRGGRNRVAWRDDERTWAPPAAGGVAPAAGVPTAVRGPRPLASA